MRTNHIADDSSSLQRFVAAQAPVWDAVCAELRDGRKQTHWMWFVFPQLAGLGRSAAAKFYGLSGAKEARSYLAHPVLGARLRSNCEILLQLQDTNAVAIFGSVDASKLRSCLTLFAAVGSDEGVFQECLRRYFDDEGDPVTLGLLAAPG